MKYKNTYTNKEVTSYTNRIIVHDDTAAPYWVKEGWIVYKVHEHNSKKYGQIKEIEMVQI